MSKFFDYFQILGLAFLLFVFVGKILYLRFSKSINPITLVAGQKGIQRVVELSFFVELTVWIIEVLLYSLHFEFRIFPSPLDMQLINSTPTKFIGVLLVAFSLVIYVLALVSFGNSWRVGIDEKTPGELVTTGIFAVSRNPNFVSLDIYFIGTFLINRTLIFLIFAVLVVVGLHYQMLQEEKALARIYGQAYQDYCTRTGRYFSWRRTSH